MERHNLFFEIELTDAQWNELQRTADTLGRDRGYASGARTEEPFETQPIQVYLDEERGPDAWRGFLAGSEGRYGRSSVEVASFHFNGGRPFASIDYPTETVEPPAFSRDRELKLQVELDRWLRNRWDELMRASGIHYDRGHFPISGSEEQERFS
jgi:hypothetical protein